MHLCSHDVTLLLWAWSYLRPSISTLRTWLPITRR